MSEKNNRNLFQRLTQLFRSGPVIRRKVKNYSEPTASSAYEMFRKNQSDIYSSTISAYGAFDRMSRYSDFSEMEACVAGDTLIATPNGYSTIEELSKKYGENDTFVVYAYDHAKGQIVPALGKQARKTTTAHAVKITFDSGKSLILTPDHRCMKRDGTYSEAQDLRIGDSMMPFYRKDLFSETKKDDGDGYRFVYTMNGKKSKLGNGWVSEHRLIAEWIAAREISNDEHVYHVNFKKWDNRPENLKIMSAADHLAYHTKIINGKKWSVDNSEWIEKFKETHSKFMKDNNPATRHDISFELILNLCELHGFNLHKLSKRLDCDERVIYRRLNNKGFLNFSQFACAYQPGWSPDGHKNEGVKNPRYDHTLTFQKICDAYSSGMTSSDLFAKLETTWPKINKRLKDNGFSTWSQFSESYENHKVASVEDFGVIDLFDLTVDGYKNYATDSIMVHNTPEIASALDIYAEETVSQDEKGQVLHIHSDNRRIRELLDTLFNDTLNIEFNLPMWVRNLCKYGDFLLFNDVHPGFGIINAYPIPISEMEREEGYDKKDPMAVRFRWITRGNQVLENWQVSHFRLLGNDAFLPYGSSVLESARRIWRQMILMEDAMLVYRIVRAPERRVFYIDIGNVPPEEVANFMEQAQTSLKRNRLVDKSSGKMDLRYNPLAVDEDYFIPVRGGESGTKIDSLAGGVNAAAIEDVQYIQKKLFAALKIPKAYLGYDEDIGAKSTLAQEDIRFSRTITRIQKVIISELNKMAMIHLYSHGYESEDLLDFTLRLSNPSTIAQQQKLELISSRFEIAGKAPEGIVDRAWVRKNIMGLSEEEVDNVKEGRKKDKQEDAELEAVPGPDAAAGGAGGAAALTAGYERPGDIVSAGVEKPPILSIENEELPLRAEKAIRNAFGKDITPTRDRSTAASLDMPDFNKMTSVGSNARDQDTSNMPFGEDELFSFATESRNKKSLVEELYGESPFPRPKMTARFDSTLKNASSRIRTVDSNVLLESPNTLNKTENTDE